MDIDLLSKMVKELILDRDRVVLPGLGTFVAEMVPASFSDKGYTINPPYRRLYFRARTDGDESLAEMYAESNNVSKEVASKILSDFISGLKGVLQEKKTVIFPGLGRLRATRENNFFFVPDEDLDIYPEGFGLAPISLKTHQETKAELSAAVEELESIMNGEDPEPEDAPVPGEVPAEDTPVPGEVPEEGGVPADATPDAGTPGETAADGASIGGDAGQEASPEAQVAEGTPRRTGRAVRAVALSVAVILILVLLYMVLGRLCPGLFDSMLYDKEQLRVLEYLAE